MPLLLAIPVLLCLAYRILQLIRRDDGQINRPVAICWTPPAPFGLLAPASLYFQAPFAYRLQGWCSFLRESNLAPIYFSFELTALSLFSGLPSLGLLLSSFGHGFVHASQVKT